MNNDTHRARDNDTHRARDNYGAKSTILFVLNIKIKSNNRSGGFPCPPVNSDKINLCHRDVGDAIPYKIQPNCDNTS